MCTKKIRGYSHHLLELSSEVSRVFADIDRDLISKKGNTGTEYQKHLQQVYKSIESLKNYAQRGNMKALIVTYANNVNAIYELFNHLKNPSPGEHPELKSVREKLKNLKTKYIRFNMLIMYLLPLLDGMETYSRYPMHEVDADNVKLLSTPEVGTSCALFKEMVGELIDLVPSVWNRLESIRPKKL
jgi:hypothetical protein